MRTISLAMCAVFIHVNVVYSVIEPARSFWEDRKAVAQTLKNGVPARVTAPSGESTLLAQLPALELHLLPGFSSGRSIPIPSVRPSSSLRPAAIKNAALPRWVENLSAGHVSIKDFYAPPGYKPGGPMVIHIQDAHGNVEAQKNIASAIESLAKPSPKHASVPLLVGIEGARGAIRFEAYRTFPDPESTHAIAEDFLREGLITGAEFAGMTAAKPLNFWGVEDETLYLAHVQALKDSVAAQGAAKTAIEKAALKLEALKDKELNPALRELDRKVNLHHKGKIGLGEYLKYLTNIASSPLPSPVITKFMTALKLEEKLDFKKVEEERTALTRALAAELSKADLDNLLKAGLAYRLGSLTHAAFYEYLKNLCTAFGVRLAGFPEMDRYIRYVLISETIKADELLAELETLEARAVADAIKTPAEQKLMEQSKYMALLEKLVKFELSPQEWGEYEKNAAALNKDSEMAEILEPFERFNRAALARNDVLVENLLKKAKEEKNGQPVLVAGGFHTAGMTEILKSKKVAYAVLAPRLGKVDGSGAEYLDVFTRDKTPLEKLFTGERIQVAAQGIGPVAHMGETPVKVPMVERYFVTRAFTARGKVALDRFLEWARSGFQTISKASVSDFGGYFLVLRGKINGKMNTAVIPAEETEENLTLRQAPWYVRWFFSVKDAVINIFYGVPAKFFSLCDRGVGSVKDFADSINLPRFVTPDGIIMPMMSQNTGNDDREMQSGSVPADTVIDINNAGREEMDALFKPIVSDDKKRAGLIQRIIDHRPFWTFEDLKKVPGIGRGMFNSIQVFSHRIRYGNVVLTVARYEKLLFDEALDSFAQFEEEAQQDRLTGQMVMNWVNRFIHPLAPEFNFSIPLESEVKIDPYDLDPLWEQILHNAFIPSGLWAIHPSTLLTTVAGRIIRTEVVQTSGGRFVPLLVVDMMRGNKQNPMANADHIVLPVFFEGLLLPVIEQMRKRMAAYRQQTLGVVAMREGWGTKDFYDQLSTWVYAHYLGKGDISVSRLLYLDEALGEEKSHADFMGKMARINKRWVAFHHRKEDLQNIVEAVLKPEAKQRRLTKKRAIIEVEGKLSWLLNSPYPAFMFITYFSPWAKSKISGETILDQEAYDILFQFLGEILLDNEHATPLQWIEYLKVRLNDDASIAEFNKQLHDTVALIYKREFKDINLDDSLSTTDMLGLSKSWEMLKQNPQMAFPILVGAAVGIAFSWIVPGLAVGLFMVWGWDRVPEALFSFGARAAQFVKDLLKPVFVITTPEGIQLPLMMKSSDSDGNGSGAALDLVLDQEGVNRDEFTRIVYPGSGSDGKFAANLLQFFPNVTDVYLISLGLRYDPVQRQGVISRARGHEQEFAAAGRSVRFHVLADDFYETNLDRTPGRTVVIDKGFGANAEGQANPQYHSSMARNTQPGDIIVSRPYRIIFLPFNHRLAEGVIIPGHDDLSRFNVYSRSPEDDRLILASAPAAVPWLYKFAKWFAPNLTVDQWVHTAAPIAETGVMSLLYRLAVFSGVGGILSMLFLPFNTIQVFPHVSIVFNIFLPFFILNFLFGFYGHEQVYEKVFVKGKGGKWVPNWNLIDASPGIKTWLTVKALLIHAPLLMGVWGMGWDIAGTLLSMFLHWIHNRWGHLPLATPPGGEDPESASKDVNIPANITTPAVFNLVRDAQAHNANAEYDDAVALYKQAFKASSEPAEKTDIAVLCAATYITIQEFDEALSILDQALTEVGKFANRINFARAEVYSVWGRNTNEQAYFKKALEISVKALGEEEATNRNPLLIGKLYAAKGTALFGLNKYPEALETFRKAISLGTREALDYEFLGTSVHWAQFKDDAVAQKWLVLGAAALARAYGMRIRQTGERRVDYFDMSNVYALMERLFDLYFKREKPGKSFPLKSVIRSLDQAMDDAMAELYDGSIPPEEWIILRHAAAVALLRSRHPRLANLVLRLGTKHIGAVDKIDMPNLHAYKFYDILQGKGNTIHGLLLALAGGALFYMVYAIAASNASVLVTLPPVDHVSFSGISFFPLDWMSGLVLLVMGVWYSTIPSFGDDRSRAILLGEQIEEMFEEYDDLEEGKARTSLTGPIKSTRKELLNLLAKDPAVLPVLKYMKEQKFDVGNIPVSDVSRFLRLTPKQLSDIEYALRDLISARMIVAERPKSNIDFVYSILPGDEEQFTPTDFMGLEAVLKALPEWKKDYTVHLELLRAKLQKLYEESPDLRAILSNPAIKVPGYLGERLYQERHNVGLVYFSPEFRSPRIDLILLANWIDSFAAWGEAEGKSAGEMREKIYDQVDAFFRHEIGHIVEANGGIVWKNKAAREKVMQSKKKLLTDFEWSKDSRERIFGYAEDQKAEFYRGSVIPNPKSSKVYGTMFFNRFIINDAPFEEHDMLWLARDIVRCELYGPRELGKKLFDYYVAPLESANPDFHARAKAAIDYFKLINESLMYRKNWFSEPIAKPRTSNGSSTANELIGPLFGVLGVSILAPAAIAPYLAAGLGILIIGMTFLSHDEAALYDRNAAIGHLKTNGFDDHQASVLVKAIISIIRNEATELSDKEKAQIFNAVTQRLTPSGELKFFIDSLSRNWIRFYIYRMFAPVLPKSVPSLPAHLFLGSPQDSDMVIERLTNLVDLAVLSRGKSQPAEMVVSEKPEPAAPAAKPRTSNGSSPLNSLNQVREFFNRIGIGPGKHVITVGAGLPVTPSSAGLIPWEWLSINMGADVTVFEPEEIYNLKWREMRQQWKEERGKLRIQPQDQALFENYRLEHGQADAFVMMGVLSASDNGIALSKRKEIALNAVRSLRPGGILVLGAIKSLGSHEWKRTQEALQIVHENGYALEEIAKGSEMGETLVNGLWPHDWVAYHVNIARPTIAKRLTSILPLLAALAVGGTMLALFGTPALGVLAAAAFVPLSKFKSVEGQLLKESRDIDVQTEKLAANPNISFELFNVHQGLLADKEEQVREHQGLRLNQDKVRTHALETILELKKGRLAAGEVEALHKSKQYGAKVIAVKSSLNAEQMKYLEHALDSSDQNNVHLLLTGKSQADIEKGKDILSARFGEKMNGIAVAAKIVAAQDEDALLAEIYESAEKLAGKGIVVEYLSSEQIVFLLSRTERVIYRILQNTLLQRLTPIPERLKEIGLVNIQA